MSRFRHQRYEDEPRTSPSLLKAEPPPSVGDERWRETLGQAAMQMRRAGVARVYLVHGTFVGYDAFGAALALSRASKTAAGWIERATKSFVNWLLKDRGNYIRSYADDFEQALNADGAEPRIEVRIFDWSSANHHLGRADAAVRLLDELDALELADDKRILLWGHSHGGNVFALLSNLLTCPPDEVRPFFEAARPYFRNPVWGHVDIDVWDRMQRRLTSAERPIVRAALDYVTFGTPIRYGWALREQDRLLHFVHHRPSDDLPEHRAALPRSAREFLDGRGGDYMQQIGIAGTNVPPIPLAWRAFWADRRLNRLLQPSYSPLCLFGRLRRGLRSSDAGDVILCDYGDPTRRSLRSLTGHLHYTERKWLPFHAAEIARRLYTGSQQTAPL